MTVSFGGFADSRCHATLYKITLRNSQPYIVGKLHLFSLILQTPPFIFTSNCLARSKSRLLSEMIDNE